MRVLFGHQSVGADLLAWLQAPEHSSGPSLAVPAIVATRQPAGPESFIAHFKVGGNGDADSKIRDFVETVGALAPDSVDVALFKFCYVDIVDETKVASLFERYTAAMDELQSRHRKITIGHVTVPLRTVRYGMRSTLRRMLGQKHPELVRNAARESFNARLRERYGADGRLFDLANHESGGSRALLAKYSDDGGHLNRAGQQAIAPAFLQFLHELHGRGAAAPLTARSA